MVRWELSNERWEVCGEDLTRKEEGKQVKRCERCGNELCELEPDKEHPYREQFCLVCKEGRVDRFEEITGEQQKPAGGVSLKAQAEPLKVLTEAMGPGGTKMLLGVLGVLMGDEKTGHRLLAEAACERRDVELNKKE